MKMTLDNGGLAPVERLDSLLDFKYLTISMSSADGHNGRRSARLLLSQLQQSTDHTDQRYSVLAT